MIMSKYNYNIKLYMYYIIIDIETYGYNIRPHRRRFEMYDIYPDVLTVKERFDININFREVHCYITDEEYNKLGTIEDFNLLMNFCLNNYENITRVIGYNIQFDYYLLLYYAYYIKPEYYDNIKSLENRLYCIQKTLIVNGVTTFYDTLTQSWEKYTKTPYKFNKHVAKDDNLVNFELIKRFKYFKVGLYSITMVYY